MDNYEQAAQQYAATIGTTELDKTLAATLTSSRPSTASRSANAIIKEAAAYAACSELLLPAIIGADAQVLSAVVSAAIGVDVDPTTAVAVETANGLYLSCRPRHSCERLFIVFKGRQFLAPSSVELQNILDEAMTLMVLRRSDSAAADALASRFPVVQRRELYRSADRIVVITLVKDHLENCFQRTEENQFHYEVKFSDLWSSSVQLHFFSLRHFREAVENGASPSVSHPFRHWLFLFAYQGRLQSTVTGAGERVQRLCDEAVADDAIAMAWEKTAELSKGPIY
ncbi:Hypothetical protein, putative [Bodo saltans]|uniref:Uncharacterized protein n=1 Tax=Bodo saltans TaxID=75058 RepID=A0A0S4INW2_BODSA|nr:Hypothetical protein, putative [Bodo saltans]|eukprot:CUE72042.1 Hypothetical protein, putative [Bodo saltans]